MKIKTKQKLNLPELIQHVWENDFSIKGFMVFRSDCDKFEVRISSHMLDYVWDKSSKFSSLPRGTTFTVEVEENVTPTTRFDELTEYIYDSNDDHHFTAEHKGANISMIIDCETHQFKTQAIYCKDTLVWTKEHGILESGVLEVDE